MDTIYWASYAVFGAMFVVGAALYWRVSWALRGEPAVGVSGGR